VWTEWCCNLLVVWRTDDDHTYAYSVHVTECQQLTTARELRFSRQCSYIYRFFSGRYAVSTGKYLLMSFRVKQFKKIYLLCSQDPALLVVLLTQVKLLHPFSAVLLWDLFWYYPPFCETLYTLCSHIHVCNPRILNLFKVKEKISLELLDYKPEINYSNLLCFVILCVFCCY
jgi:hypothetical protein